MTRLVAIDMAGVKEHMHNIRRGFRNIDLDPLDKQISYQIPGVSTELVEAKRQNIRDTYADIQNMIDSASDLSHLVSLFDRLKDREVNQWHNNPSAGLDDLKAKINTGEKTYY
jgi:hypothetical protein